MFKIKEELRFKSPPHQNYLKHWDWQFTGASGLPSKTSNPLGSQSKKMKIPSPRFKSVVRRFLDYLINTFLIFVLTIWL